jgi:HEAT repeat protein
MKIAKLGLAALLAFSSVSSARAEEQLYKGRPVLTWLAELVDADKGKQIRAEAELRNMGTNAIPSMLKYVTAQKNLFGGDMNSSIVFNSFTILGAKAKPAIPQLIPLLQSPDSRGDAANALICIGDETASSLITVLDNEDPQIRETALMILRTTLRPSSDVKSISPKAAMVLPSIRKYISDKNPSVSINAMSAFSSICTNIELVVKEITPNLESESAQVRNFVAIELRFYGPHGKAAIPALKKALSDKDGDVRTNAALALHAIDPAEAKKAGAKVPLYE